MFGRAVLIMLLVLGPLPTASVSGAVVRSLLGPPCCGCSVLPASEAQAIDAELPPCCAARMAETATCPACPGGTDGSCDGACGCGCAIPAVPVAPATPEPALPGSRVEGPCPAFVHVRCASSLDLRVVDAVPAAVGAIDGPALRVSGRDRLHVISILRL